MAVTRDYSIQTIDFKDTFASAPTDYSGYSSGAVQGANTLLGGAISRTSTFGGRLATVKAGEDIRPALESLRSAGGGTLLLLAGTHRPTYDIVGGSKISIIGEGIDQTVIDFGGGAYSIKYEGEPLNILSSFKIQDLTVLNSTSNGVRIYSCDNWDISSVKATEVLNGFKINNSQRFLIINSIAEFCTSTGFSLDDAPASAGDRLGFFTITNCDARYNDNAGFVLQAFDDGTLIRCTSTDNGSGGFLVAPVTTAGEKHANVMACTASGNGTYGIRASNRCRIIGSRFTNNTTYGLELTYQSDGYDLILIGCHAFSNGTADLNGSVGDAGTLGHLMISGCVIGESDAYPSSNVLIDQTILQNTSSLYMSPRTYRDTRWVRNTSGVTLSQGNVVVLKSTATAEEITTTTTLGDDRVIGVLGQGVPAGTGVANNGYTQIIVGGFTDAVKVNGITDIAIGDFLSTYSVAGIAAKANDGDMAFAIALEAYTGNDSNGVIEALIISPRKVGASAGGSGSTFEVLDTQYADIGNITTGEDNLLTYTLPAGKLAVDGQYLRITAWGTTTNNANTKNVKLYFGAQTAADQNLATSVAGEWIIESIIVRDGPSSQRVQSKVMADAALGATVITRSQILSNAITIKCTGTATATNDIIQKGMVIEYFAA